MTRSTTIGDDDDFEQELFELIARYEDDCLEGDGLARLNELLVGSERARDIFNDVCLQSLAIGEALSAEEVAIQVEPQPDTNRKLIFFPRLGYAAAALVALMVTVYFLSQQEEPTLDVAGDGTEQEILTEPLMVRVHSKSGSVEFLDADGTPVTGDAAKLLASGKSVATHGPDSGTVLVYPDGTRIELGPDSLASLAKVDRKLVLLKRGQLSAAVQPQPVDHPFGVRTPHLELTVVGTEFLVTVEDDDTAVRVLEGNVRVERLSDESKADLAAGQEIAVARDGELLVASLSPAEDIAISPGGASSKPKDSNVPPVIHLNIGKEPIRGVVGLSVKTILRGRILDANGRPASHARVSFHVDSSTPEAVAEVTTDAEGRFETKVDVPGKLIARVGSTIEAKVVAVRGQVTDVGDLVPDTK